MLMSSHGNADADMGVLWTPTKKREDAARITDFIARFMPGADYRALHEWSLREPGEFWKAVWDFCEVIGEMGDLAYVKGPDIPGTRFFPDARINYAQNLLRGPADRTALVFSGEDGAKARWSMGDLRRTVARLVVALAEHGVGKGDNVAGIVANTPEAIAAMLATQSLGAVWTSCSPDFGAPALVDRLGQVRPKVVFASSGYSYGARTFDIRPQLAEFSRHLDNAVKYVVHPFVVEDVSVDGMENSCSWESFVSGDEPGEIDFVPVGFREPGFILYSSGTTGMPKCIVHSAGGMLLKHLSELSLHGDVREGDTLQYLTTCGWMMWNWQASALALGATLAFTEGSPMHPAPDAQPDFAWANGVTHFGASAKYFSACEKARVAPIDKHGRPGPRTIFSTGSPLLPASFDYLYRAWGKDLHVASISGGTDICACFVGGVPINPVRRGCIQAAELGCDVAALGEDGRQLVGEPGELVCRNAIPSMPLGFWDDADGSRVRSSYFEKNAGVWSQGDWVTCLTDGSLVISGRSDATLNPGGVRIGTAEIYRQVEGFGEVVEAVAVGQDLGDDQQVLLFVRLAVGIELDAGLVSRIKSAIRAGASPRHVPAMVVAVDDIPRTRSGKIAELAVRDVVHDREVANVGALANPEALDHFRLPAAR